MALPLDTVVKQLADSGIIAPGKLENFVPPKANPQSAEEFVAELVKNNHLTPFQATQVKAGKAKALILGNYTILDKIGAGGMGQVFKAEHRRLKRVVALKMLPPAVTKDAMAVARFQREVEAAARLRHTNIVATDDADQAGAVHFLIMEYIEGKDLSALVKKDGPFPVNKAVNYILQAARGLEFAHGEGVVHRDIKPANLLLDKKGTVKILDMGLARIESEGNAATQAELTGTGTVMGTVDYMAPEQALNTKHADARADIYSLGISLYYLIAGRAVYGGDSLMEKLLAHREQPIPSLQDAQTTVPKQLDAVFKKMVAKKIEDRYQTMSEVVAALEALGYGGTGSLNRGEIASTVDLSSADRKKLAKATKKPLGSITEAVASEKTKYVFAKLVGGAFGTIIAPVLVFYLIRHLEKEEKPAAGSRQQAAATVAVATNNPPSPLVGEGLGASGQGSAKPWNTPAFQQWVKATQALPAEKQIEAVSNKLMELNPGFDGKMTGNDGNGTPKIENGVVTELGFVTDNVTDISPVRALVGLKVLCGSANGPGNNTLSDLSPLQGMKLTTLHVTRSRVSDLAPLEGMPLTFLYCSRTPVSDLSPLKGAKLVQLNCGLTNVSDLLPLQGMNLTHVRFPPQNVTRGLDVVRQMKSITSIGPFDAESVSPATFWKKYDAGEFGKPAPTARLGYLDPAFQAWVKATQALPAEQQIEAVRQKLTELNPGFDEKVRGYNGNPAKIENGVVTEIVFFTDNVTDISPVRVFSGLKRLACPGRNPRSGKLSDLSPLQGMNLTELGCHETQVSDLLPLKGMKLTRLICTNTRVSDLSPLREIPLTTLDLQNTPLFNLSPLQGMPLTTINCNGSQVSDLTPLHNCMALETAAFYHTKVTPAGIAALAKSLPNCKIEWDGADKGPGTSGQGSAKPWKTPAFQQWVQATQILPAEQQIEAVSKKLMELNPKFGAKFTGWNGYGAPKIVKGVVTGIGFFTADVTDISPVRAFVGLKELGLAGGPSGKGALSDLSPLQGLPLDSLNVGWNPNLSDFSPLKGMKLKSFSCTSTKVTDFSPLEGMSLDYLACGSSPLVDLSSLAGTTLTGSVNIGDTKVFDLSPLRGQPLKQLAFYRTKVTDLSPLRAMSIEELNCPDTAVSDLTPLQDCKSLRVLNVSRTRVTPAGVAALAKSLPNCKIEWDGAAGPKTP